MANTTNGRRGPRHVVAAPQTTRLARTIRRRIAAEAARVLYPAPKEAADRLEKSVRTIQRWRNDDDAKGSPYYHAIEALQASDDPADAEALFRAIDKARTAKLDEHDLSTLIATYHELREEDAAVEGIDNGHKVRPSVGWMARYFANTRDAQVDLWLAAFALEFARRGVGEEEVFHG